MNKRGAVWEELADVFLGGALIFLAVTGYLVVSGIQERRMDVYFQEKTAEFYDEQFVSYLGADIGGMTLADSIRFAYYTGEEDQLSSDLDEFLEKIYSSKVCWELQKNHKSWLKENSCHNQEKLFESSVAVPAPDGKPMVIGLKITGYAKGGT